MSRRDLYQAQGGFPQKVKVPGAQSTGLGLGAGLSPQTTPQGSPAVTSAQPRCSPQPPNPAHLASVREGLCSSGRRDRARVWGPAPCPLALGQPREALDRGVTGFAGWSRAHAAAVRGSSPQSCKNHPPGARRETDRKGPLTADSLDTPDHASHLPFLPPPRGPHTGTSKSIVLSLIFTKVNQSIFCGVWLLSRCF